MSKLQQVAGLKQLEQLRNLYSRDSKYLKEFYCLENYLELHKKDAKLRNVKVYVLPELELGLFVIVDRYQLFMGCLESADSEELLKDSLSQLTWFGGLQCGSMPHRYFKAATQVIQANKLRLKNLITNSLFLSQEKALQFEVNPPVGFYLKSLSVKDAQVIDDHWKWSEPGSLFFMQRQIAYNICVGLYEEENGELVAWCVRAPDGLLAALQVKDSHKRRGFGVLIVKEFSRRVALQGLDVMTEVDQDNQASSALFHKMGFQVIGQCHWLLTEAENGNFQWPDGE
ncbi:uncharacterized protein [Drosophila kikkawai]|uniref:N-acetyltransferase domain-containing protein n=1 Tax=Drosophila kikkawai TaxID=30033 RepID=A0A6P4J240_DROKI|nr:uncharacterized protein LOC108079562 [Drosophila kikkawai]